MYSLFNLFEVVKEQAFELIDVLGPDNIFLSLIIIGFFFLLTKVLVKWKLFQDEDGDPNMSSAGVVAVIISFLIAWLINRSGAVESVHAKDIFDYLGYSTGPAATIIPLVVLGVFIYMIFKIGPLFLIFGGLALVGASFTDLIYSTGAGIFTGIVLLLIGILWWLRRRKRKQEKEPRTKRDWGEVIPFRRKKIAGAGKFVGKGILLGGKKVIGAGKLIRDKTKQGWGLGKQKIQEKKRNWAERQAYKEKAKRETEEKAREEKRKRQEEFKKEMKKIKEDLRKK